MPGKLEHQTVDSRGRDFLTEAEMKGFLEAARQGRHGVRDYLMMLMTYRHGLRVSELVDLRLEDLDKPRHDFVYISADLSRPCRIVVSR